MKIESGNYDFHGKYFLKDCFSLMFADLTAVSRRFFNL